MMTGIAAALLVFTGIWHLTEWLMAGRNRDTLRLIPFGLAYVVLGCWLIASVGGFWASIIALIVAAVGLVGAVVTMNTAKVRKWVTVTFIAIDVAIVGTLLIGFFS